MTESRAKIEIRGFIGSNKSIRLHRFDDRSGALNFSVGVASSTAKDALVTWHNCVIQGPRALKLHQYLKPGQRVEIAGLIQPSVYKNKDGVEVQTQKVFVRDFEWLHSTPRSSNPASKPEKSETPMPDTTIEVPF